MKRLMKLFRELKLNQKFTLLILGLVFLPMLVFSVILFQNMEENAISQILSETQGRIAEHYSQVQKTVDLCNLTTQAFVNNQELNEFLQRLGNQEEISTIEYYEFDNETIATLERLVNSNPYLYQIRVYANNDLFPEMMPILYHQSRKNELEWIQNYISGSWYFDYSDDIQSDSSMNVSKHLMALVSTIKNRKDENIGTIEVAVEMDEIFPVIFEADSDNWACFIQENGKLVRNEEAEQNQTYPLDTNEILEKSDWQQGYHIVHTKIAGNNVILAVQPMKELSGTYIQITDVQQHMDAIARKRNSLIVLLGIIFIAMFCFINLLVKTLLQKFYETLYVIRQVQSGDMDVRVQEVGNDEMGELGSQINEMLDRIQILMKENVDREVLMKNTEIKALQNQINAHFIYNVLESVKMMAEIDEEYEISDAVTALGELLRYSMKWVSKNVTIRQEVNHIQNYITLMNLRYDFTIGLSINISERIYEQEIPKMSLQPIVENAICHGIEELDEDATIYIKSIESENEFRIEITDSGKGMDEEQLQLLYKKLLGEIEVSGGSGNGIGLKNVQDRIHIQFGSAYGLEFASKEGCFTKVIVKLPITVKQKEGNTI